MIPNLDAQSQLFLSEIDRAQQRVASAQQQITSGKRVNSPSDDPDVVSEILRLRSALESNTQIQANLQLAQSSANVADSTLTSVLQLLDRAETLAAEAANGTQTADGRLQIADEVQALEEQLVSFSQAQSQGSYIFSGDQDASPAYQLNLDNLNGNGVDRLSTAPATRQVEDAGGGSFVSAQTAQDIFDHRNADDSFAPDNAFAALDSLRVALTNNDVPAITSAIDSIKLASDHINTCQAFYGAVENRIQNGLNLAGQYNVQLKSELSQKEDADIVAASLELNQGNLQIQAALQMKGSQPRTTLFDFLSQ